jgi:hypothetical protein
MILRFAQDDACGIDLEGKKGHLEGTWRAVVRKSIYTGCGKTADHKYI